FPGALRASALALLVCLCNGTLTATSVFSPTGATLVNILPSAPLVQLPRKQNGRHVYTLAAAWVALEPNDVALHRRRVGEAQATPSQRQAKPTPVLRLITPPPSQHSGRTSENGVRLEGVFPFVLDPHFPLFRRFRRPVAWSFVVESRLRVGFRLSNYRECRPC